MGQLCAHLEPAYEESNDPTVLLRDGLQTVEAHSGKGRLSVDGRYGVAVSYWFEPGRLPHSYVGTIRGSLNRFGPAKFAEPMMLTCFDNLKFEIFITCYSERLASFKALVTERGRAREYSPTNIAVNGSKLLTLSFTQP
jgi:hypothetical protein